MVEKKGVKYTIRAFAKVSHVFYNTKLLILGDGPLRQDLEALTHNLGLTGKVSFAGASSPDQVQRCLQQSDVFVQHSIIPSSGAMEGSPVAIAEASSSALPVIVTHGCGGTEKLVVHGETGFLVPQRDIETMARYMLKLARDPALRKRLGSAGRKHIMAEFNSENQISKLEDVLLKCSDKSNGSLANLMS